MAAKLSQAVPERASAAVEAEPYLPTPAPVEARKEPLKRTQERKVFDDIQKKLGRVDPNASDEPDAEAAPAKPKAEKKAPAKEEQPAAKSDGEKKPEGDDEVEYTRARHALARSGFKAAELDALSRAELIERGLARAEALAADDRAHDVYKKFRKEKGSESDPSKESPAKAPPIDIADKLKPISKALALDDGEAKALEGALASVLEPLLKRVETAESALEQQRGAQQVDALESARQELSERFPELEEPDKFDEVIAAMSILAALPKYQQIPSMAGRIKAVMRKAAEESGLKEKAQVSNDKPDETEDTDRQARRERRQNGRPSTQSVQSAPRELNRRDQARIIFDHVNAHPGDIAGARRAAGLR